MVDVHALTSLQDNTGRSSRWFLLGLLASLHVELAEAFLCELMEFV